MEEKKEKKIISADSGEAVGKKVKPAAADTEAPQEKKVKQSAPVGNAKGLRIGAVILWLVAIAFEVLAVLILVGKINLPFMSSRAQLIVMLVLDLVCVIIGSQLWKKANHIDPVSEKNKLKFWLWNNMGLIVCAFAFIPFIILVLTNKNADKKTKVVATVVAVIALLIGCLFSFDWNPVSAEQKQEAVNTITENVFWSPFGHVYHTDPDCQALNRSDTLTTGSVEQAIAANRTRLCQFCAKRDNITNLATDEGE